MRWISALAAGLVMIGASAAPMAANAAEKAPVASPAKPPVPQGFKLKSKGSDTLVHIASKTQFPVKLAGFTRIYEDGLDLTGQDVLIAYLQTIGGEKVVARMAMIQIVGMTPKEHFLGMQGIVGSYFKTMAFTDIVKRGEGPFDPPGLKPNSGYQGRFSANLNGVPYELSLSTVKLGKWDVRLTAAYPASAAPEAQANIIALAADLLKTAPKQKN